jgi:hypothetical protein
MPSDARFKELKARCPPESRDDSAVVVPAVVVPAVVVPEANADREAAQ